MLCSNDPKLRRAYKKLKARYKAMPLKADDIAAFLKKRRVKGYPRDGLNCPLRNWFQRAVGDGFTLEVAQDAVTLRSNAPPPEGLFKGDAYLNLAPGARAFVRRFDRGDYPELRLGEVPRVLD